MTHQRNALLDEIETVIAGVSGLYVTTARFHPIVDLPHCTIMIEREDTQHINLGRDVERELQISMEIIAAGTETVEAELGVLCESVEIQMMSDPTFNSNARETYLRSTELEYLGDGDQKHAKATIAYSVFYTTTYTSPSA